MAVKVFAVYDVKAAAYGMPMFLPNAAVARRVFGDICGDPESPFCQHPGDYRLDEIGEYDQNTGRLGSLDHPLPLDSAASVVAARVERLKELKAQRDGASAPELLKPAEVKA